MQYQPPQQAPQQQTVATYVGTKARDKAIRKMMKRGWRVQSMTSQMIGRGATKFLIGFLAKQKQQWTVTYYR